MAYINDPKYIQINEFINPFTIIKTVYEKEGCTAYVVSWSTSDGQEKTGIMQVFPAEYAAACGQTEMALISVFGQKKINCFNGTDAEKYLLIELSAQPLQWDAVLERPLAERLDILLKMGAFLSKTEEQGIVVHGIDLRSYFNDEEGALSSWDLSESVSTDTEDAEMLRCNRKTITADFALLTAQVILGKAVSEQNCLLQVALALQGQVAAEDQALLLEELSNGLSGSGQADPQSLMDVASLVLDCQNEQPAQWEDSVLAAANFLEQNPLWKYVRRDSKGEKRLDILLTGVGPMTKAFLDVIIPCTQMLDTAMHIRVISPEASVFCDQYLENAPLLAQVLDITHIPPRPNRTYSLNGALTGKDRKGNNAPFAYVTFENADFPNEGKLRRIGAGCILLTETWTPVQRQSLMTFTEKIHRPVLIGIPSVLPNLEISHAYVDLASFAETGLVNSKIEQDALAVHTFYSKESNQRISRKQILKDFENRYNRDSSIRSALSIPYKLYAYGLAGCEDVSDRFYNEVLGNKDRVQRLVWLEHRSWQAHMMVNGWTLDTDNFERDFIHHKYRHKMFPWHSCLFGSNDTPNAPLASWSLNEWDNEDLQDLDPLDQMSVLRHRILKEYVQQKILHKIGEYTENKLYPYLERKAKKGQNPLALFQQTKNVLGMLHSGVSNAEIAWEQLKPIMPQGLCTLVDCLLWRNDLRNFKDYDRAIITAIPYLLRNEPVRRVYKLCAEHPWQNIAACVFIEPSQWILVTDKEHTVSKSQLHNMLDVLYKRRQICVDTTVLPLDRLSCPADQDQWDEALAGTVLDITGASAQQVLEARNHPLLGILPTIEYRQGKLHDLDTPGCQIHYYNRGQYLTVEETMAITGTKVLTEKADIPMQRMWQYKALWEVVQRTPNYYKISDYLNYKLPQCYKVYPGENTWTTEMPRHIAEAFGLIDLLDMMVQKELIRPYTQHNIIRVNTTALFFPIRNMLNALEKEICNAETPEKWNFEVLWKGDHWIILRNGTKTVWHLNALVSPWNKEVRPEQVEGLKELLLDLKRGKIVKNFTWQIHNGWVTTEVTAADKRMQDALGKLLDGYLNTDSQKRNFLQLRFGSDDPNTLCTLDNLDLSVCETMAKQKKSIHYQISEKPERWAEVEWDELLQCLKKLAEKNIITIPAEGLCTEDKNQRKISFRYTDLAYRDCLTKTGNALEVLVYHTLREMHLFDDVKLGVNILWDRQDKAGKDTQNEIDIICTKGMRSYFISCKNTKELSNDYLTEIRYETDRFGVDGTAILVCTTGIEKALPRFARAERMGVKIISLQDYIYRADMPQDSAEELRRQILTIVNNNQ